MLRTRKAVGNDVTPRSARTEVHDVVGREGTERLGEELPVAQVADLQADVLAGDLAPPAGRQGQNCTGGELPVHRAAQCGLHLVGVGP